LTFSTQRAERVLKTENLRMKLEISIVFTFENIDIHNFQFYVNRSVKIVCRKGKSCFDIFSNKIKRKLMDFVHCIHFLNLN
jgi:hypothetical protein